MLYDSPVSLKQGNADLVEKEIWPLVYSRNFYEMHTKRDKIEVLIARTEFLLSMFQKLKYTWQPVLCKKQLIPCIAANALWVMPGAAYLCAD